ncbi:MAG TPA: phosphomannomutase/phosphoglucomutase [Polyangia bacterium]|nr:phosphomannomutase/phosphoglucomutase [Polyangia bacterium]
MTFNPRVFREYDIRGVADRDLPDEFAGALGKAIGTHLRRAGGRRITLGRDCRVHSPRLHAALRRGLLSTGLNVLDVGIVATPVLYFSVFHFDADGGVQITGSHNPPEDNGFKVLRGKTTIYGEEIQALRKLCESGDFERGEGRFEEREIHSAYQDYLVANLQPGPRRFRVVVDAGNGVGGVDCVPILRRLGFETIALYCEPDGRFPHHHPDPTVEKNVAELKAALTREHAEVGLALDGDADRLGVVDLRGRIVWGDQLLILFARDILRQHPGATFVSEVKCSQALYDEIERLGGHAIMWKVGHSLIKSKMKEEGALLAGEMSGHIFFAHRYFGYDDAIYAGLRLVEMLSRDQVPLEVLVDGLPKLVSTPEIRVECADDVKFDVVARLAERLKQTHKVIDVDGVRVVFPDGWGLVRASNTQPVLVLRFEAQTAERLAAIRSQVEQALAAVKQELAR